MLKTTVGAALSALLFAGLISLTGVGSASAESVMKQCGNEWKAAKAAGTTNGQTWQEFLKDCKSRKAAGATPAAEATPAAAAATPTPTPTPTHAPMKPAPAKTPAAAKTPATGAGEFTTEDEAKAHCPSDTVVWVNTKSHKYHYAGHKAYGTTKRGAYMCEADATAAGDVAAKGEKAK